MGVNSLRNLFDRPDSGSVASDLMAEAGVIDCFIEGLVKGPHGVGE